MNAPLVAWILATAVGTAGAPAAAEVGPCELVLRKGAVGVPSRSEGIVEGFGTFPRGALFARDERGLADRNGRTYWTQLSAIARYDDDSVRAASIAARVPDALARSGATFSLRAGRALGAAPTLLVSAEAAGVAIDTGAMRVLIGACGDLLPRLESGRASRRDARPVELRITSFDGRYSSAADEARAVGLRAAGPLGATVGVVGSLVGAGGDTGLAYRLELTAFADAPVLRGRLHVDATQDLGLVEDLELSIPVDVQGGARVTVLGGDGATFSGVTRPVTVVALDGETVHAEGPRGRVPLDEASRVGLIVEGGSGRSIGVAVSRLAPNAPRMIEWLPSGVLRIVLHAGPFILEHDFSARVDFELAVPSRSSRRRTIEYLETESTPALRAPGDPTVLPGRSPIGAFATDAPGEPVARLLARVDRAVLHSGGYPNYGDYRYRNGWANLEYDPAAAFLLRYLATSDARHLMLARDMLRHWVTYDVSRGEVGTPAGFPWMHGDEHRSLELEAGHVWAEGLVLGAIVLGDHELAGAAVRLKEAVLEVARDGRHAQYERGFAWLLLAIHDLRCIDPDPRLDQAAEDLVDRLVARQDAAGFFRIDRPAPGEPADFVVSPWVSAGLTCEALYRHQLASPAPRTRDALIRLAGFLLGEARLGDGRFARRVLYGGAVGPGATKDGRAGPVDELLIAAGLGRMTLLGAAPGARAVFEETRLRACAELAPARLSANEAARALVAVRSVADTLARLGPDSARAAR